MRIEPVSRRDYFDEAGIDPDSDHANGMYLAYRNQLVHDFRKKYHSGRCLMFNYTYGFHEEVEDWCNENDPGGWALLEDYGSDWPIGFSHPDLAFAFKMRWSDGLC